MAPSAQHATSIRLRARVVLEDCRSAYSELKTTADPIVFRRRWFGLIAILRAVGHVLRAVDGEQDRRYRAAIEKHWTGSEAIFRDFIKLGRDTAIKEYRSGLFAARNRNGSPMRVYTSAMSDSSTAMSQSYFGFGSEAPLPYVFRNGPFKGRNWCEVVDEALRFWEAKLSAIESEMSSGGEK